MKVRRQLLGCLYLWVGIASTLPAIASEQVWLRLLPADRSLSPEELFPTSQLQPVSFGLTSRQHEQIYALTNGTVNFRNIYRMTKPKQAALGREDPLAKLRHEFLGTIPYPLPPLAGVVGTDKALERAATADPDLGDEWWLAALGVVQTWEMATGQGVTIADCDSGYHTEEPDLAPNLVLEERRDFSDVSRPTVVTDGAFVFHGTAVAAIMAGVRDGSGTNGIAYQAKVIPLQNYNYDRSLDNSDKEEATARCVLHALRLPAVRVIVVENQTPTGSSETFAGTRDAIRLAISSGITVVSAAGNNSLELKAEANDDSGSIIVGALRRNGRRSIFSNWGSRVTISAFGEGIRTLYGPGGQIETFGGTTAAAAQVAATVALMLDVNPTLTPQQVRSILIATRRLTTENRSVGGMIDVYAAVRKAASTAIDALTWKRQQRMLASIRALLAQ